MAVDVLKGAREHTKGPWRIQMLGPQTADLISGGTFMGLNGGSGAPDKYEPDDAAEWEANVRLIAAAPDLLEALRRCAKEMRGSIAFTHGYDDALAAADAAISLATPKE